MIPVGARSPRVAVMGGDRVVDALSGWEGDAGIDLSVETAAPADSGVDDEQIDCVVADGGSPAVDAVDATEQWATELDAASVVVLTDGWGGERVAEALAAGADEALPRTLVYTDPELLGERVVEAVTAGGNPNAIRTLFDSVNDGVCLHDPRAEELLDVNGTMAELTGYDRETLLDRGVACVSAGTGRYTCDRAYELQRRVAETGEAETVEWAIETADGDERLLEATLTPATVDGEDRVFVVSQDVTERRELEATYRGVFENVSDGLVVHHPETGEIRDVNTRFCEMNGYDREDLTGETVDVVTAPAYSYDQTQERIRAAREEGPQLFEWRNQRADGETYPVEVHLSVVEIAGEERVLGSVRDVTERHRTERRLSEILDRIDEAVYLTPVAELTEPSQSPDYLSSGYEEIWGQPLDRLRETNENGFFDTIHPDDEADYRRFVEGIVGDVESGAAADSYTTEYRIRRPDGEIRWVHSVYYPLEWEQGPPRVAIVSRDITERKRTRRNLRLIAERVDEAIYMSSPDKRVVYYASPSFEDLWDIPTERIYEDPQAFLDRVHPDDREWFREEYERIRRDLTDPERDPQNTYELEYRVRHDDGDVRWISVRGYPVFDGRGGVDRWIAVNRDVTERKERERRVTSFEDATEDLATANSPAEATETAVEAASETLSLPAVGAFLYDGDDGVLRPEAVAGSVLSAAAIDPVTPDDGALWEAFATGATVTPEDVPAAEPGGPLERLDAWRALALGNHGVLLVGDPGESLGSETIQAAHILAATLEAALNHLRGKKRLAAREEQLRTQTQRAERLDRIARLTQRVEAALTDASSPRDVERAVCDRLAGSGPYDLAWIGGTEVGADRLTTRTVVGAPEQYVAELDLTTTDGTADPHPAVAAWRSGGARVVNSLVDDGPADEWRRRALSEGYQSLCAVPLTYDGVTHGVLTIGTDTPRAFEERERDVLEQLGTSIANALAAIERRRALESDETVELEFRGPGEALSFVRTATAADCRVTLERTAAREDGSVSVYFGFEGDVPDDAPEIARETLPGAVEVVAETPSTLVEVRTDEWFGATLAEYGGMLREATADPEEAVVRVEVPKQADVRSFVERLRNVAPSLELVARRQHEKRERTPAEVGDRLRSELTDRQLEVLQTALSAGYFEWPREHDGSEVASRLDITQPTFNKHLRIAERETFGLLFGGG